MPTPRQQLAVAALATDVNAQFAPVQLQKLFFLIDENLAPQLGGKQYNFAPYDYGPFDVGVYRDVEQLAQEGLAQITGGQRASRRYSLTPAGYQMGQELLAQQPAGVAPFLRQASSWVRSMPFGELVGSIYKAYPHMRANSIFVD